MSIKSYGPVLGLLFYCALSTQAHSACNELSPNPNPIGSTAINVTADGCYSSEYVNDGTLINAGTLTQSRGLLVNNGTLNNSGVIMHNGVTNTGTFNNSGDISARTPDSYHINSGVINNSGRINNFFQYTNNGAIFNSGVVSDTGYYNFDNNGLFVNVGTYRANGYTNNTGTFLNYGVNTGLSGGFYSQTSGVTLVDGTMNNRRITLSGGTLQGNGTITNPDPPEPGLPGPPVPWFIINGGTINAGGLGKAIGTLTADADLTFQSGTLLTEISGAGSADLLKVTDTASFLAGTFAFSFLNNYLPNVGDSWTFLEAAGGITGWDNLSLAYSGVPSNYLFAVSERDNTLVLSVAAVPEPEVYASMALGLALLGYMSRRRAVRSRSSV